MIVFYYNFETNSAENIFIKCITNSQLTFHLNKFHTEVNYYTKELLFLLLNFFLLFTGTSRI